MIDQVGHTDGHASVFTSELLNPQFELPEKPKSREVLLRTAFAGLCHSDLHFIEGLYPIPTPVV